MERNWSNMNIYLRELTVNRRSLVTWSTLLAGLGILMMAFYPTIAKEAETFERLIAIMPKGLLATFGLEKISVTDLLGFYSTKHYLTITLLGSIYAIMLSSGILSKEESEKTIEFLLSKPISRSEIVTNKLLSFVTILIALNVLVSLVMYIILQAVKIDNFSTNLFVLLSLAPLLLHLTFASVGFLISVFIPNSKTILSVSVGIVLATYFLSIASTLSDKLSFLKYLSPFKYVDAVDILTSGRLDPVYLALMAGIFAAATTLTYIFYSRKNITI